jgi:hypothetical protein
MPNTTNIGRFDTSDVLPAAPAPRRATPMIPVRALRAAASTRRLPGI